MGTKGMVAVCAGLMLLAGATLGVAGATARTQATTTILVQALGLGSITGGGGQINCGNGAKSCYATYVSGDQVTIVAAAGAGWTFTGWDDDSDNCEGTDPSCTIDLDGTDNEEAADFAHSPPAGQSTLTLALPTGGNVSGWDIDCGGGTTDCTWSMPTSSTATLVETPSTGYSFAGWGGACTGTGQTCTVSMTGDRNVTASFTQAASDHVLTVTVTGNGTVTGGGIACTSAGGSGCTATEPADSNVTLTATPGSGAGFTGWGGACAGSSVTCTVTMSTDKSVTADFSGGGGGSTVPLAVTVSGSGSGRVTGGGIDCGAGGSTCAVNATTGSSVTLTATPATGSTFDGWGGACSGTATTCSVTMDSAKAVSAGFSSSAAPPGDSVLLTLRVSGAGSVASSAGTCSSDGPAKLCTQSFARGASVVLTARAANGGRFVGWSGACSGTQTTCNLRLTAATTVNATFTTPGGGGGGGGSGGTLSPRGRPAVQRSPSGYAVTLRFTTSQSGTARVRVLRAGRIVTAFSSTVPAGATAVGPFRVASSGYYRFAVTVAGQTIGWTSCLGRCGAAAAGRPFVVTGEAPTVRRAGQAWSITVHVRSTLPADARLRLYRGNAVAVDYHFAPGAGRANAGPFVVSPGTYTLRLSATDGFGRTRTLTWFAYLP
jgi:uncharacterized repeat protein (TIGR02543 family)